MCARKGITNRDEITLMKPSIAFASEFLSATEEFRAAGYERAQRDFDLIRNDFPGYIRRLNEANQSIGLKPGYVPTTALEHEGGHIGYAIRPSERQKGYGTCILALTLEKAGDLGLNRVLLTCDTDNIGSARIIERNGGQLASRGISNSSGKPISRYWIDL